MAVTPPATDYAVLDDVLDAEDADAYVHIGDCFDEMLYYLTRFAGPDREYAFVYTGRSVLCAPGLFEVQANREFPGDEVVPVENSNRRPPEERAVDVLQAEGDVERVAVPESATHRTVSELNTAGYDVVVTDEIDGVRRPKSSAEIDRIRAVEGVAQDGMARAKAVLAAATPDGDSLRWNGEPLTTERVRREINAVMAGNGVTDAGNTIVGAGESCADLHFNGDDAIHPDETVLVDLGPRGPVGYYGDMTRTFVPGRVRDWEETVYDAVHAALQAGFDALEDGAGTVANDVHSAITDEIERHGFETGDVSVGMYHGSGHGVGTSLHEPPFFSTDETLQAGDVVTVEPGVYDPDRGGVRLEDLVVVTEDGFENLVDYPYSIDPSA